LLRHAPSNTSLSHTQSISVYVNGVKRPLTRQLGTATQGAYTWDTTAPSTTGCWSYYFHVVTSTGAHADASMLHGCMIRFALATDRNPNHV
jgi:hypothetical protein